MRGRPRAFDRETALRQALRLFWEHGYENTSMAELTAAMGIKGPSLYAAFGDKEALFGACLELYQNAYALPLAELAAPSDQPARVRLVTILETCAREYTRPDAPKGCFIALSALQCAPGHAGIAARLREKRLASRHMLLTLLAEAHAAGELAGEADLDVLAGYLAAVIQGMSVQAKDGADTNMLLAMVPVAMAFWPPTTV